MKLVMRIAVVAATLGSSVPHPVLARAADGIVAGTSRTEVVRDVALGARGVLVGQVVTRDGLPRSEAQVVVAQDGREVGRTATDEHGSFSVAGLSGGIYVVSTDQSTGVIRAWAPTTAPPAAARGVLLVPDDLAIRGQGHLDLGAGFNRFGIGGLAVLGLIGTVLVVAIDGKDAS